MTSTTDRVVSADGTRIVFHSRGDGPPLLVIHGTLVPADMYLGIVGLLSSRYRVVLMERRGYEPDSTGPRPATFAQQAADVAAVLAAQEGPSFVFGHSCGGLAALHATAAVKAHVRRLAVYEPPAALVGPTLVPTLHKARELIHADRPADAVIEFITAISDPPLPAYALRRLGEIFGYRAQGMLSDLECITGMDPDLGPWSTVDTSTLLLAGAESDPYGIQSILQLQDTLPNTQMTVLPGLRHHIEDFEPVATALADFFV